jgi:hypothetical protein
MDVTQMRGWELDCVRGSGNRQLENVVPFFHFPWCSRSRKSADRDQFVMVTAAQVGAGPQLHFCSSCQKMCLLELLLVLHLGLQPMVDGNNKNEKAAVETLDPDVDHAVIIVDSWEVQTFFSSMRKGCHNKKMCHNLSQSFCTHSVTCGAHRHGSNAAGLRRNEICELCRVVCLKHNNVKSWMKKGGLERLFSSFALPQASSKGEFWGGKCVK